MEFISWDFRPAVLGETEAKALLEPGDTDWVAVDFWDVFHTGGVMEEADWRERFRYFGAGLDKLPVLDQPKSANSGIAKEHSPLVTEILARTLEHQAQNEPLKLYRNRKMRTAQIFREKMNARRRLKSTPDKLRRSGAPLQRAQAALSSPRSRRHQRDW